MKEFNIEKMENYEVNEEYCSLNKEEKNERN